MKKLIVSTIMVLTVALVSTAQTQKNKAVFKESENDFYKDVTKSLNIFNSDPLLIQKYFKMDFTGMDVPKSADEFTKVWTEKPESQGRTGTCWCFSTTSFYESEIYRTTKQQIVLSELYTVYWEYVEKARAYVKTRGSSFFGEGSETNAVARMMKIHGIVPAGSYLGILTNQPYHDHEKMFAEMNDYLKSVKNQNAWNEELVISTIKSILNHYIGAPPTEVMLNGKKMTPQQYLADVCKINPDDYVDFMSLMEKPYWKQAEYDVPDNWWNSDDYYNVPLDVFMNAIKQTLKQGFSLSLGGDVSESGTSQKLGVAMVPTYDIPSEYIDENARQMRFSNGSTTDDHAMHLVGFLDREDGTWFLLKDSGSGAHNNQNSKGYYFYHEDYIKLKMISFTVHKDAVEKILEKFPEYSSAN